MVCIPVEVRGRCHLWNKLLRETGLSGLPTLSHSTRPVKFFLRLARDAGKTAMKWEIKEQKMIGQLFCGMEIAHSRHTDLIWLGPTRDICLT